MYRAFINETEVIKAVSKVIYQKPVNDDDITIRPRNPEYPEQCWIELHHVDMLSYQEINRLQRTLHRTNMYSINVCSSNRQGSLPFLALCANTTQMYPKYFHHEP